MTEQTKAVFNDPQLLRQKLGEYLDTANSIKIEHYALAAEKFFAAGERKSLKYKATWSWPGFFFNWLFLSYRKVNDKAFLYLILISVTSIFGFIPMIFAGIKSKFYIIKRFELALDCGDAMFKAMSGKTMLLVWLIIGLNALAILFIAISIYFLGFVGFIEALSGRDIPRQNSHYQQLENSTFENLTKTTDKTNKTQSQDNQKEQMIKNLYAHYMKDDLSNQPLLPLLSKETKMLWDKAEKSAIYSGDEIGCLEFDPVIDGQEWDTQSIANTLKVSSLKNGNVLAEFYSFDEKKEIEYSFICIEKCAINDLIIKNQDRVTSLKDILSSCLPDVQVQNEANDPLEATISKADEVDKKLNEYYKQIMKTLYDDKKEKFRNAQRAWIKFAANAQDTKETAIQIANARLEILEIQTNFLKSIIDGNTPKIADDIDVKYYENEITQFLNNINNLPDYQRQSVTNANKAWEQYAKLKKEIADMMGLDGDEVYKSECKFWAEFLSYINF